MAEYSTTAGAVHRVVDLSPVVELFADGFESGTTSAWAAVLP